MVLVSTLRFLTGMFHNGSHLIHLQIHMFLINMLSVCLGPQLLHKFIMQTLGLLSGRKLYCVSSAFVCLKLETLTEIHLLLMKSVHGTFSVVRIKLLAAMIVYLPKIYTCLYIKRKVAVKKSFLLSSLQSRKMGTAGK